jgi:competence protein ComEC
MNNQRLRFPAVGVARFFSHFPYRLFFIVLAVCSAGVVCSVAEGPKPLQIYFVDVEGGQSTLFVTPEGHALLIDTGWADNAGRDADRIVAAAKSAGISKIDLVWLTHYHGDHSGGIPQLADRIPIGAFADHGENRETDSPETREIFDNYQKVLSTKGIKRISAKPGDVLPVGSMTAAVVSGDGNTLASALPGAGAANPYCDPPEQIPMDPSENLRSLGTVITYEKLRILDLGDLPWNKEKELVCPANKLGKIDIFVVSHHGSVTSDSRALVNAIGARVAIMDNGATKGDNPDTWTRVHSAPGLEDLWQLHAAQPPPLGRRIHAFFMGGNSSVFNVADPFIANLNGPDSGNYLKVVAWNDGNFDVYNSRTNATKHYAVR